MRALPVIASLLLAASAASADDAQLLRDLETTLDELRRSQFETTRGLKPGESLQYDYGVYATLSALLLDEPDNGTTLLQADGKIWGRARYKGHSAYGRLRVRYRDFSTGDSFDGRGDQLTEPIGDRYWYRFDWRTDRRAEEGVDPGWNWWVQLGRQYVHFASGMALSQALYAVRGGVDYHAFSIELLGGVTPGSGTIDFDGSRPGFTTDTDRRFWAVKGSYKIGGHHTIYAYFLAQNDHNDSLLGAARFAYDSRYAAVGAVGQITGALLYRAEFLYEFGDSISDTLGAFPQSIDDIAAFAGRLELIYTPHAFRDRNGLRFEFEFLLASGDEDRLHSTHTTGGNTAGTDDESFNAFGYQRTGFALGPSFANLISIRLGASMLPLGTKAGKYGRLRVAIDAYLFLKFDDMGGISVDSIPGEGFIGGEIDLIVEWQIFSDLALDARYGVFLPGDAIVSDDARHFLYLGVSYGF